MRAKTPEQIAKMLAQITDKKLVFTKRQLVVLIRYIAALEATSRLERLKRHKGVKFNDFTKNGAVIETIEQESKKHLDQMLGQSRHTQQTWILRTVKGCKLTLASLMPPKHHMTPSQKRLDKVRSILLKKDG